MGRHYSGIGLIINGAVRSAVKVILVLLGEFCSIFSLHMKKGKMRRRQRTGRGFGVPRARGPTAKPGGSRGPHRYAFGFRVLLLLPGSHKGHDASYLSCCAWVSSLHLLVPMLGINVFSPRCFPGCGAYGKT